MPNPNPRKRAGKKVLVMWCLKEKGKPVTAEDVIWNSHATRKECLEETLDIHQIVKIEIREVRR